MDLSLLEALGDVEILEPIMNLKELVLVRYMDFQYWRSDPPRIPLQAILYGAHQYEGSAVDNEQVYCQALRESIENAQNLEPLRKHRLILLNANRVYPYAIPFSQLLKK